MNGCSSKIASPRKLYDFNPIDQKGIQWDAMDSQNSYNAGAVLRNVQNTLPKDLNPSKPRKLKSTGNSAKVLEQQIFDNQFIDEKNSCRSAHMQVSGDTKKFTVGGTISGGWNPLPLKIQEEGTGNANNGLTNSHNPGVHKGAVPKTVGNDSIGRRTEVYSRTSDNYCHVDQRNDKISKLKVNSRDEDFIKPLPMLQNNFSCDQDEKSVETLGHRENQFHLTSSPYHLSKSGKSTNPNVGFTKKSILDGANNDSRKFYPDEDASLETVYRTPSSPLQFQQKKVLKKPKISDTNNGELGGQRSKVISPIIWDLSPDECEPKEGYRKSSRYQPRNNFGEYSCGLPKPTQKRKGENYFDVDFYCEICSKKFKTFQGLEAHTYEVHPTTENVSKQVGYLCNICFKYLKSSSGLEMHILSVHSYDEDLAAGSELYCELCFREFKTAQGLEEHTLSVHPFDVDLSEYLGTSCNFCLTQCNTFEGLEAHTWAVHPLEAEVTSLIPGPFCEICYWEFKNEKGLLEHIEVYHPSDSKISLPFHASDYADLCCEICCRKFKTKDALISHRLACHPSNSDLSSIIKISSMECENQESLEAHMVERHPSTPVISPCFHCNLCKLELNSRDCLIDHALKCHTFPKLKCHKCHYKVPFKDDEHLLQHLKQKHGIDMPIMICLCPVCQVTLSLDVGEFQIHVQNCQPIES